MYLFIRYMLWRTEQWGTIKTDKTFKYNSLELLFEVQFYNYIII